MKQANKLTWLLSMAGLDGSVSIAALAGLFTAANALSLAVLFIAGPGAIVTAALLDGTVRERMVAALLAGAIATVIVVVAAGLGPKLLQSLNITMLKAAAGVAIMLIGLLIMGLNIPTKLPTAIIAVGFVAAFLLRG